MKKVLSIGLALIILCGTVTGVLLTSHGAKYVDANKLLLNTILTDRYWIIESLVNGDFDNNPYSQLCTGASGNGFMEEVLTNYEESAAFKALVDGMELYRNSGQYVTNWTEEIIATILDFFGFANESTLETYVKSVDNIQYEDIINAVLTEDYTTSWGTSLFEDDSNMEWYRQCSKVLKKMSAYQKALRDNNDILAAGFFESQEDFMDYADNFISAYEDTLYEALIRIPACSQFANNEALTKKILSASAMAFLLKAETYNPLKVNYSESDYTGSLMSQAYFDYFADDIGLLLKGTGKVLKFNSVATNYAMILNALATQTNTTAQVLNRIGSNTSNEDIRNTMDVYQKYVEDQGKVDALAFDSILNNIAKQDKIGKEVLKAGGKLFTSAVNLRHGYFDGNKMVMTNALCENLIKVGKCVNIGVWVADKATNIKETSKKIYICKYINKLINASVKTFKTDYNAYKASQTDENAKKVLDDLEFIKKLRLYGEKQGYGCVCSQTDSIVGLLMGGNQTKAWLAQSYQGHIDALMGCTLVPIANTSLTIKADDTITVLPYQLNNGNYTIYARLQRADGKVIDFPEADSILMNELILAGGTVNIYNKANVAGTELFLPNVSVTKASTINVRGSKIVVGEINNKSNLTVNYLDQDSSFLISDNFTNSGTLNLKANGQSLRTQRLQNSGTVNVQSGDIKVYGTISSTKGNYQGEVRLINGEIVGYENSYITDEGQALTGTGNFTSLSFQNNTKTGITISGTQTVSGNYSDLNARLSNSENIYLTGSCQLEGNKTKNTVSFKDYTSQAPIQVGGAGIIYNNVTFNNTATLEDGLKLTSSCNTLTLNAQTKVKGDFYYVGGTISGNDWLKLYGDANITASSPSISKLDFSGLLPQKFNCTKEITVNELDNHNLSVGGVDISSKVNVTSLLHSSDTSAFTNGKNLVLTGNAKTNGNRINGSISAKDWTCTDNCCIKGTLFASGNIKITNNASLEVLAYEQSAGDLTVDSGSMLYCKDYFSQAGTTNNNGTVLVDGDSKITKEFTGGTLSVKGDINASSKLTIDNLIFSSKVLQTFKNSSTTEVNNLTINNNSNSGFNADSVIQVKGGFVNNAKRLNNGSNIKLVTTAPYTDNGTSKSDLTISGSYTLAKDKTLTVNGALTLQSGTVLTIKDGARLLVKRGMISDSATIVVEQGGSIITEDYFSSSKDTLNIAGNFIVKGDAKVSSSTVNASGVIQLNGDLSIDSGTWNKPNLAFVGKVPQAVSDSAINVGNLEIRNTSKTGISFSSTVNYYGTLNKNSSVITGENKLVKKG